MKINLNCRYCHKPFISVVDFNSTDVFKIEKFNDGWKIVCYADCSGIINFCPMCGRKLKKEGK